MYPLFVYELIGPRFRSFGTLCGTALALDAQGRVDLLHPLGVDIASLWYRQGGSGANFKFRPNLAGE